MLFWGVPPKTTEVNLEVVSWRACSHGPDESFFEYGVDGDFLCLGLLV